MQARTRPGWYGVRSERPGDLGCWRLGAVAQILSQQLIITLLMLLARLHIITQYSARTQH